MSRKKLDPQLFWKVLRSIAQGFGESADSARRYLIPAGNPGAGMLHGRDNVAKTCTYRATYVPGGFNKERDARRKQRAAKLGSADWLSKFGTHTVVTDGVF